MDIKDEIENRYKKLSEKDKDNLLKDDKKTFLTLNITFSSFFGFFLIIFLITYFLVESQQDKNLFLGFAISCLILGILIFLLIYFIYKKPDEKRIKRALKVEIQNEIEKNALMNPDSDKELILKVTIVDSYTQVSDKLHAVLNYQEIIQKRYYKFKVDYKDGSSKVITAEDGSDTYNKLIVLVGEEKQPTNEIEKLKQYKQLLDDNLITEDEYNQKKKQLLSLDSNE